MPDADPRLAALRRLQAVATGALLVAIAGWVMGHAMGAQGGWAWVIAACEAATIGALADWFAVVALFRRPLGLPLPHTAIVPRIKDRIADTLAQFVRDHFLAPDVLLPHLRTLDPAAHLGQWLRDPARVAQVVNVARSASAELLALLEDERLSDALHRLLREQARQWNASASVGQVLGLLTREERHHALLDAGLHQVAHWLGEEPAKKALAAMALRHIRKEWPWVIGLAERFASVPNMADSLAAQVSASAIAELREVLAQPHHPLRQRYDAWVNAQIERLRHDASLMADVNALKDRALDDPVCRTYVDTLWRDIRAVLHADLAAPDSHVARHLAQMLTLLGERLAEDPALRTALNTHLEHLAGGLSQTVQNGLSEHIARTLKAWDDERLVAQIERSVGRDLQFIRLNGTLIGAVAGLVLHALRVL